MNAPETLAERLTEAMDSTSPTTSASDLARACGVSPTAVHKWLGGGKMSADNLALVARALGVRDEWLRTGRLPRARDSQDSQVDHVLEILASKREPLAALTAAIDALGKTQAEPLRKRRKT